MSKKRHDEKNIKGNSAPAAVDPGAAPETSATGAGVGQQSISREDYHALLGLLQVEGWNKTVDTPAVRLNFLEKTACAHF